MVLQQLRSPRRLAAVAVFSIVAVSAVGFAASNTVPNSKAGDGSGTVTGYTVTDIDYNLNATNPGNIDSVTLTLNAATASDATVRVQLVSAGAWYTCPAGTDTPTCTTTSPQAIVLAADNLRLVVAD